MPSPTAAAATLAAAAAPPLAADELAKWLAERSVLETLLRRGMREQLKQLREQWQIPIVMISHDIDDVLALADEALVIEQGQVLRQIDLHSGTASEFFSPENPGQMPHPQARRIGQLLDPDRDG